MFRSKFVAISEPNEQRKSEEELKNLSPIISGKRSNSDDPIPIRGSSELLQSLLLGGGNSNRSNSVSTEATVNNQYFVREILRRRPELRREFQYLCNNENFDNDLITSSNEELNYNHNKMLINNNPGETSLPQLLLERYNKESESSSKQQYFDGNFFDNNRRQQKTVDDNLQQVNRFFQILAYLPLPRMSFTGLGICFLLTLFICPRVLCGNILFPVFRLVFGTLYPAYASYKAVRTKDVREYVKWMMYWIVFAFFTCIETFTDIFLAWFPFYYEMKVIIVLWLLSPATRGSSTLYRKFVHPMLTKREQEIDEYLAQAKEKGYTAVLQLGSKGVNYATSVIMKTAIKGGGNLVQTIRRSYSLSDLSEPDLDRTQEEVDSIGKTLQRNLRSRNPVSRSSSGGRPASLMYFSEVDVSSSPSTADDSYIRSSEDISSGYSSAEQFSTGLSRTASVTNTTRTRLKAKKESEDFQILDNDIKFVDSNFPSYKEENIVTEISSSYGKNSRQDLSSSEDTILVLNNGDENISLQEKEDIREEDKNKGTFKNPNINLLPNQFLDNYNAFCKWLENNKKSSAGNQLLKENPDEGEVKSNNICDDLKEFQDVLSSDDEEVFVDFESTKNQAVLSVNMENEDPSNTPEAAPVKLEDPSNTPEAAPVKLEDPPKVDAFAKVVVESGDDEESSASASSASTASTASTVIYNTEEISSKLEIHFTDTLGGTTKIASVESIPTMLNEIGTELKTEDEKLTEHHKVKIEEDPASLKEAECNDSNITQNKKVVEENNLQSVNSQKVDKLKSYGKGKAPEPPKTFTPSTSDNTIPSVSSVMSLNHEKTVFETSLNQKRKSSGDITLSAKKDVSHSRTPSPSKAEQKKKKKTLMNYLPSLFHSDSTKNSQSQQDGSFSNPKETTL